MSWRCNTGTAARDSDIMTARRFRPEFWPTVFLIPALALMFGLGIWQLERLAWKTDLIDRIESAAWRPRRRRCRPGSTIQASTTATSPSPAVSTRSTPSGCWPACMTAPPGSRWSRR
jgi:hypothetical protein